LQKPHTFGTVAEFGRFSNRPFGVKRFQTIHRHHSVDVSRGEGDIYEGVGSPHCDATATEVVRGVAQYDCRPLRGLIG
jgi:hypothetical protein